MTGLPLTGGPAAVCSLLKRLGLVTAGTPTRR
jgi:hypothetical protein